MRIVSLLPAATEIVGALGQMDRLVGVSHECDYPEQANDKPRVTRCEIHGGALPSAQVDDWVSRSLVERGTLYTMDEELLRRLQPDVILTQKLCDICAVGYESVTAFAATLPGPPQVVNLEPACLQDVFEDILRVGRILGHESRGLGVVRSLAERVEAVRSAAERAVRRPRCVLLEWIDPPYCSGHWNPELVEIAGGDELLGRKGQDSVRITWESVLEAAPEILVLACCGYPVKRTLRDLPILQARAGWRDLLAVRSQQVYVVDGIAHFSRPGPRLVDSLEILAEILYPTIFGRPHFDDGSVVSWTG